MRLIEAKLAYQPKTRNNKLVSLEVLLRPYNCSNVEAFVKSHKSPIKLDCKVLEMAYSDMINANLIYPVSINVSYFSLINSNFIRNAIALFKGFDVTFELTEHYNIGNLDKLKKNIEILQYNGFNVSLDDFGKGFSSVKLLTQIDFNEVKIDKSIISNIDNDFYSYKHLVFLSEKIKTLGVHNIVYEGIERKTQLNLIKLFDDNAIIQGYYYSYPLPLECVIKNRYSVEKNRVSLKRTTVLDEIEKKIYKMIISESKDKINNEIKDIDTMLEVYNVNYKNTISNFKKNYY
ncbi:GGDEF domain protein [Aliivibrio fischeri ES114]|uniref:GGDEF domain protein n=1 Tax=Aliivibrio fischeri (strain ATCC 700601 / ES114) TaxID=312309 RepID=Q5E050_ALIF1|nr:EAL domain-containing protein [Aliivibrio fischeri]AAW87596.1 GGDEF domain protein [Aliivibrio fischeri ES114]MUK27374.1 EAL domain-containing protein [Aliivibrio fischeri]MUK35221.1 EAL domain-containing protein [Aliivibrio fischeri]